MMIRSKLLFLFCVTTLFSTDVPLYKKYKKLTEDGPISKISTTDRFTSYNSPKVPEILADRLEEEARYNPIKATFTKKETKDQNYFIIINELIELHKSPEYSHVPKLSISLKPELNQLDTFLSEAGQLKKAEKAYKYTAIRSTLDQIIFKVNEAIKEAVKETVYSSDDIEAAYAKLLQLGDVLDLVSNELAREINFDSQRLETDGRKELYATLIELRNALARDEEFMNIIVHLRSKLGNVYRISFPDYERVRTEAYYVLKLARKKMGWNEDHLHQAIIDSKKLLEELYKITVNDWKDLIPEIPYTHIKGIRFDITGDDKLKSRFKENEPDDIELTYKKGPMRIFNLEKGLGLEWIKLCEIFETVYEDKPAQKAEELYRLLCALGDFDLICRSRQFLFFPWFNPMTYTRRLRRLHTGLHFFKTAFYAPLGKPFALDIMHSISEHLENRKKKETPQISILNEAAFKTFIENVAIGANPAFFSYSDMDDIPFGLSGLTNINGCSHRSCFSYLRELQSDTFNIEKKRATKYELSILKRMENHEILFMLEALHYRYDIAQGLFLKRILDECETDVGSDDCNSPNDSSTT